MHATVFTQESADAAESIRKVDSLAQKANTNLDSLLALNRIIRGLCYSDDSIGKAVEAIIANVNTSFKLHWRLAEKSISGALVTISKRNLQNLKFSCSPCGCW